MLCAGTIQQIAHFDASGCIGTDYPADTQARGSSCGCSMTLPATWARKVAKVASQPLSFPSPTMCRTCYRSNTTASCCMHYQFRPLGRSFLTSIRPQFPIRRSVCWGSQCEYRIPRCFPSLFPKFQLYIYPKLCADYGCWKFVFKAICDHPGLVKTIRPLHSHRFGYQNSSTR